MTDAVISFPSLGITLNPPSSFHLFGLNIHLYGMVIAFGFLLAVLYCAHRAPDFGLKDDNVYDVIIWALPLGIIGARAYYIIFNYGEFAGHPERFIQIWNGGLAIYGGIIAGVLTAVAVCKVKKISIPAFLDVGCFGLLIGQLCGRWGNFFNREAFGSETTAFLRMGLTTASGTIYVHPTFLYESLWNFAGLLMLHFWSKKGKQKFDGQVFLLYVLWYGIGRGMIEGLRTDSLYIGSTDIRVSQLLAIVSAIAAAVLIVLLSRKPHTLYRNRIQPETTPDDSIEEH